MKGAHKKEGTKRKEEVEREARQDNDVIISRRVTRTAADEVTEALISPGPSRSNPADHEQGVVCKKQQNRKV